jgi:CheY-like chemotaxis protein
MPVLVVDDEPNHRSMVREVLELEGYTVFTAEHGGPALDRLRATASPLLVLLGLMMPHVTGEQVLEAIAAEPALARHRVILVTGNVGWATSGRVAQLREQLHVPLVPKPFTVDELVTVVADTMAEMP